MPFKILKLKEKRQIPRKINTFKLKYGVYVKFVETNQTINDVRNYFR